MRCDELSQEQWELLGDLFPTHGERGGQRRDHCRILNDIFWTLRTGAPWRDLPKRYGPWLTLYDRFPCWQEEGLFSEDDPVQFMMNIVSLSIFSVLGVPVVEAIFNLKIDRDKDFFEKRFQSIVHLLKKGMLP